MSHLRGYVTVLEIVFVGQCEVFVCLDFVHFFFFPWPRSSSLLLMFFLPRLVLGLDSFPLMTLDPVSVLVWTLTSPSIPVGSASLFAQSSTRVQTLIPPPIPVDLASLFAQASPIVMYLPVSPASFPSVSIGLPSSSVAHPHFLFLMMIISMCIDLYSPFEGAA